MQTILPCDIIRDLLPLYAEGLTSDATNQAVRHHLEGCPHCAQAMEAIAAPLAPADAPPPMDDTDAAAVRFLRRARRRGRRRVALGVLITAAALLLLLAARPFVIPWENESYLITYVEADDDSVRIGGTFTGRSAAYHGMRIASDGTVRVYSLAAAIPRLNQASTFTLEFAKDDLPATGLTVQDLTIQPDGTVISALANRLYARKNPYVGDISADQALAGLLDLPAYRSQLQTDAPPYGWTLEFTDLVANPEAFDASIRAKACVLLATIDNLEEVTWTYRSADSGEIRTGSLSMRDGSAYAGADLSAAADSPQTLQALLDALGL